MSYAVITKSGDLEEYRSQPMETLAEASDHVLEWRGTVPVAYVVEVLADGTDRPILPVDETPTPTPAPEELGEWK